jgi:hypothetical protein
MAAESLRKGTVVEKINSESRDGHRNGARGKVLSAFGAGYFVEWADAPGVPVFVLAAKIREVNGFRSIKAPRTKKKREG